MNRRVWLIAIIVAALASIVFAAAETGTVKGVVSKHNSPVAGARVVISSGSDSSYTATVTTDQAGRFSFPDAPLGTVEVKVYDSMGNCIANGTGVLKSPGEVITLLLEVTS